MESTQLISRLETIKTRSLLVMREMDDVRFDGKPPHHHNATAIKDLSVALVDLTELMLEALKTNKKAENDI